MRYTFFLTALLLHTQLIHSAPSYNVRRIQLSPEYMRAITAYRRLEQRLPREELRALTTIGILNGARQAEEQMETHLIDVIKDLLENANTQDAAEIMPKIDEIEKQLDRDEHALQILTSAMDLATSVKDEQDFKQEMRETMRQVSKREHKQQDAKGDSEEELAPRIAALRQHITKQFAAMKSLVDKKITHTLDHLIEEADQETLLKKASEKVLRKRNANIDRIDNNPSEENNIPGVGNVGEPVEVRVIKSILSEADFRNNLLDEQQQQQQQQQQQEKPEQQRLEEKKVEKLVDVKKQQVRRQQKRQENKRQDNKHKSNKRQEKPKAKAKPNGKDKDKEKKKKPEQRKVKTQPKKQDKNSTKDQNKGDNKDQHKEKRQDLLIPIPIEVDDNFDDSFALDIDISNITGLQSEDDDDNETVGVLAIEEGDDDDDSDEDTVGVLAIEKDDDDEEPRLDEEEASPELDAGGGLGGGGLVGIITSLSGGEGGSDVGALIGALTGVISTLFGPGGLDIESLISTGTSLISGLLAGNKNFGTVLGQYVGTAFDGLSGGGGAINNGQFLGNFLGTVVASLSADPEDEAGPQPLLFAQTLLGTFLEAKNRKSSEEVSEERKGSSELPKKKKESPGAGSDSGSFVKQIVAHIVSNLVSVVLNASLGASGGASHASASLFTGSSSASHQKSAGHHARSWT